MDKSNRDGMPKDVLLRRQPSLSERSKILVLVLSIAAVLLHVNYWYLVPERDGSRSFGGSSSKEQPIFISDAKDWEKITPSTKLEWHSCYSEISPAFQCARLTVPMDYSRPLTASADNPKVHIALVLKPAYNTTSRNGTTTSPSWQSPLFLNPGGPGGSGVTFALSVASAMQTILGPDRPVLGFDPRGIGFTLPRADCFAEPPPCPGCKEDAVQGFFNRIEWLMMTRGYGTKNLSDEAILYHDASQRSVNLLCDAKDKERGEESVLGHASTAHVAMDMLSIIDAWDVWQDDLRKSVVVEQSKAAPEVENPTKGKLVYWGFSYGTYLGQAFAALHPDRVGRMVLDGVVDAEYYVEPLWKESLLDTDKVIEQFFIYCAAAGSKCDFYRDGNDAGDIGARYRSVMDELDARPVTFVHPTRFTPVLLTTRDVRALVFLVTYSPVKLFPILASVMSTLEKKEYYKLVVGGSLQQFCLMPDFPAALLPAADAQRAVMCADKSKPVEIGFDAIKALYDEISKTSEFSELWMELLFTCNGWKVDKDNKPSLPWQDPDSWSTLQKKETHPINTSYPILFLSSTYDPVTPLKAAVRSALLFKGAGLLEQKSMGHCTIATVSLCTAIAVRSYVVLGLVPPAPVVDGDDYLGGKWITCQASEGPWGVLDPCKDVLQQDVSAEDVAAMAAFRTVQIALESMPKLGQRVKNVLAPGRLGDAELSYESMGWGMGY